jgi:acyl-CoA thioesterase-1
MLTRRRFLRSISVAAALAAVPAVAQQPKTKRPAKKKKAVNPAFEPVVDDPNLPRALLIGDSISMGYHLTVRDELKGIANVHRPAVNCGPTTRGVESIDQWLGDGKWGVIHFNFGLHDLKYVDSQGKNAEPAQGKPQVSLADYEKNLEAMVERMKKTGAKLIFATTTPVPAGSPARKLDDQNAYNAAALAVMKQHDVAIDDLHAFAKPILAEIQRPANVHFTPEGSKRLGKQVAAEIKKSLAAK